MTDEQIIAIAHRTASTYDHRSDPSQHSYGFVKHTLLDFVRKVLEESKKEITERLAIAAWNKRHGELSATELMAEIAHRPIQKCEECQCFRLCGDSAYNPCTKGHTMSFRFRTGKAGDDCGFYRNDCADRVPL